MTDRLWHRMRDDDAPYRGSLCAEEPDGWVTSEDERVNCVGCLREMAGRESLIGSTKRGEANQHSKRAEELFEEASESYARAAMYSQRAIDILQDAMAATNAAMPDGERNRA
jgi:hypothetical protein